MQSSTIISHVFYRDSHFISEKLVRNYVKKEKPLNCAGSTKFESLGICFKTCGNRRSECVNGVAIN